VIALAKGSINGAVMCAKLGGLVIVGKWISVKEVEK
jgi:hypothetical protein